MKVRAVRSGFYQRLRAPGDVFDVDGLEALGAWMEPVEPVERVTRVEDATLVELGDVFEGAASVEPKPRVRAARRPRR